MRKTWKQRLSIGVLVSTLAVAIACGGAESTATPLPQATAQPAATPTQDAGAVTTPTPGAVSTPTQAPQQTRVLPTATPSDAGEIQYGGTLRFIMAPLDTLDTHMNTLAGSNFSKFWAIYNQLIHMDPNDELIPELAESWDVSGDGTTITFHLREGVEFHDGTPFNAQAVKWNFDRMMDPDQFSPRRGELAPYVESVEVEDDMTLIINMVEPLRPFLSTLASDRMGYIISPSAVEEHGEDYGRNPVGTGPFEFVEWVEGQRVVTIRNENYWDEGKPYLDGIRFIAGGDPSVDLAMLRTDEVDMLEGPRAADVPLIDSDPNLNVGRYPGVGTNSLHFSPIPPFDNLALRQAIAYAMDGETFAEHAFPGSGRRVYVLERLGFAANPDLKPIEFDPDMARQKLNEAGYSNGVTVPAWANETTLQNTEIIQAILQESGITLDIQIRPTGDTFNSERGYYVNMGFNPTSGMARRADPHINIQRYFHSRGGNNYQGLYSNPQVDSLIEEASTVYDIARARELYTQIQQIIVGEDTIHVPYAENDRFFPHRANVEGFEPRIHGRAILQELWFSR